MGNGPTLGQILTFRDLVAPMDRGEFLASYYGKKHLHLRGDPERFSRLFGWTEMEDLLAIPPIWSNNSLDLALGGRVLDAKDYCYTSVNREGDPVLRPDIAKVRQHLRGGATLVLDFIDLLTPELRSVTQTLETVTGAQVTASTFLSWQQKKGYAAHFDVQSVFALQIVGRKVWRVFEGRHPNTADMAGGRFADVPAAEVAARKGRVLDEVVMEPGDLLYLPPGLYHAALTSSEASLHLSFGVFHQVYQNFVDLLCSDLSKDAFFRQALPHYDDVEGHRRVAAEIAERLGQIVTDPKITEQLRFFLKDKFTERVWDTRLPDRGEPLRYRVCWPSGRLSGSGETRGFERAGRSISIDFLKPELLELLFQRDFFRVEHLAADFGPEAAAAMTESLGRLEEAGVIERL